MIEKELEVDVSFFNKIIINYEDHKFLKVDIVENQNNTKKLKVVIIMHTNYDENLQKLLIDSGMFDPVFLKKDFEFMIQLAYNEMAALNLDIDDDFNYKLHIKILIPNNIKQESFKF